MHKILTAIGVLLALCSATAMADDPQKARPVLASPVTHSDWMLHDPAPTWGPAGVRQILDRCKSCGWKRIYWRVFDGGRACYPSRLLEPLHGFDDDNYHRGKGTEALVAMLKAYDFGSYDAFAEAIRYGHSLGLEVHAWLTINEDDHGWGLASRFTRGNPESRWMQRDGTSFRSQQSFAFEKVRAYKLALVREVLAYKPDGMFFDWIRTGDVRDNPQTDKDGIALYGYEQPNIRALKERHGLEVATVSNADERWVRIRAEPQTVFMREASRLIRSSGKDARTRISVLVQQPWGYRGAPNDMIYRDNLYGLLVDLRQWASEGLIDEVFPAAYYREGGSAESACHHLRETVQGKVPIGFFGWINSVEQFAADTRLAETLKAPTLLLWESDYIALPPAKAELVQAMASYAQASRPAN